MSQAEGELVLSAPAKVNLNLHVLGKRPDGYHELDTVMQKLALADTVRIQRLPEPVIQLSCPDSDLPENDSNLVWKAAAAFLQEVSLDKDSGFPFPWKKKSRWPLVLVAAVVMLVLFLSL